MPKNLNQDEGSGLSHTLEDRGLDHSPRLPVKAKAQVNNNRQNSVQEDTDPQPSSFSGKHRKDAAEAAAVTHRDREQQSAGYVFFPHSCIEMQECQDNLIALTVTSPPYWNSIDYDVHAKDTGAWHREREYSGFGDSFNAWLDNIQEAFKEVHRVTVPGGFCAIVVGTILNKGKHYPAPMMILERMLQLDWEFHQDIIWNKVTGGVRRAGSFIQRPHSGYFYPNIMTEYILVFRKEGEVRRGTKKALDIDVLFKRDIANNVWHIAPVPPRSIEHPCPFPEELVRRLVCLYSQEDDIVLDPFLGSGQTALVALREGRRCIGYDIEESYLNLAQSRIEMQDGGRRQFNLLPIWQKLEVRHGKNVRNRA